MLWQEKTLREVYFCLGTAEDGLTHYEAEARLSVHGENTLTESKNNRLFKKIILSFADIMTGILFAAAAVSFAVSKINGESTAEAFIILAIVFLNSFISVIQENRAEKALEALKELSQPHIKVMREGVEFVIESRHVVPGDIISLEKGSFIPADCRVSQSVGLVCDESALTGESHSVYKTSEVMKHKQNSSSLSSAENMVWAGTVVTGGHGRGVAVSTGMETRMGHIASLLTETPREKTPLQKRLVKTSTSLGNAALIICIGIFALSVARGFPPAEMFLTSVSLAVAAIPEGLPAIVTIMLSIGVTDMAKQKAVVKRLPAVETLGCSTVICSDKTGTLTQNKMTLTKWDGDTFLLSKLFLLNNRLSSPTEQALFDFAASRFPFAKEYKDSHPIIAEIPFDSHTKIMVTLHKDISGYLAIIKGAPEEVERFSDEKFEVKKLEQFASRALRVIGVGYARLERPYDNLLGVKYTLAGLAGIADTLRPEAKRAVGQCRRAGIKVVMITGDYKDTAVAIARELGIPAANAYTQREIEEMGEEREEAIRGATVIARATPEFKVKIIEAYKKQGGVVAMTGDGVNDAPALKKADIGCAMGKSGTDVAREACDLILTDDNFATIVKAIKAGRGIYANIRRSVHFLISCNIGEIAAVLTSLLLSLPSPLTAVQLLWVNLVTDSLPAIALGMEKVKDSVMDVPPIKPASTLLSGRERFIIGIEGVFIGGLSVIAYLSGSAEGFKTGSTMAFGVLSFSQLFHSFNMRSEKPFMFSGVNLPLLGAVMISSAAQAAVMLTRRFSGLFGTVPLSPSRWLEVLGLSASILVVGEIVKFLKKKSP
ncbi:MAG: cation-translocating P-type ATPase [Eubacteriales bacterium]